MSRTAILIGGAKSSNTHGHMARARPAAGVANHDNLPNEHATVFDPTQGTMLWNHPCVCETRVPISVYKAVFGIFETGGIATYVEEDAAAFPKVTELTARQVELLGHNHRLWLDVSNLGAATNARLEQWQLAANVLAITLAAT